MARRDFGTAIANNSAKAISSDWVNDLAELVRLGIAAMPQDFYEATDPDYSAAFIRAIDHLKTNAVNPVGSLYKGSGRLFIPAGDYRLSQTLDITHTLRIEGESVGSPAGAAAKLTWGDGVTGIRIQRYNTEGASSVSSPTHFGGDGTVINGLHLEGGYAGTEGEYHGIHSKARATIEHCAIGSWAGDGVHMDASAGAGAPGEGNANCFYVHRSRIAACRNGINLNGADANAGLIIGVDCSANRRWGFLDSSFLGNIYIGCHAESNGLVIGAIPTVVHYNGRRFGVIVGQEAGASNNAPPGSATNNAYWYYLQDGGADAGNNIPTWQSGTTYRSGGCYMSDDPNSRSTYFGCYVEGGQGAAQIGYPALICGGFLAQSNIGSGAAFWQDGHGLSTNQHINLPGAGRYKIGGTQVVGAQGASVADATDNATAITQLNALLARLRAHGLIAT